MSFLDRIRDANEHDLSRYRNFVVDGRPLGWLRTDRIDETLAASSGAIRHSDGDLTFAPVCRSVEQRTAGIRSTVERLAGSSALPPLRGEIYPAASRFSDAPAFLIDRAAVPHFGLRAWGVHLNGFTRRDDGIHMWIGRRARNKATYPGMLDNMVAGGQPFGLGLFDNLIKECAEEADLPERLAHRARPVGAVTYVMETEEGLKPDVQFCFDIELAPDFVPRNTDGEIEEFHLWPVDEVADIVANTREFKTNCNLVIIDFLIRHGFIPPEDPDYVELLQGLHP